MRAKLSRHFDADEIEAVLDDLAERGLQSDRRFAEAYVHGRIQRGFGPLKIRAELERKGLKSALMEDCLAEFDEDWADLARRELAKRFPGEAPAEYRERARRGRFLVGRGFPESLVRRLVLDD